MEYTAKFLEDPLKKVRKYGLKVGMCRLEDGYQQRPIPEYARVQEDGRFAPGDDSGFEAAVRGTPNARFVAGSRERFPFGGLHVTHWTTQPIRPFRVRRRRTSPQDGDASPHSLEVIPGEGHTGAYVLPWDPRGGVVYMTLGSDADYFFTDFLSGCSIMIDGPPDQPTVYHFGVDFFDQRPVGRLVVERRNGDRQEGPPIQDRPPTSEETNLYWDDLYRLLRNGEPPRTRIDKRYYVTDHTQHDDNGAVINSTLRSRAIEALIIARKGDPAPEVAPFGGVFGLRENEQWSFYLAESATIKYCERRVHFDGKLAEYIQRERDDDDGNEGVLPDVVFQNRGRLTLRNRILGETTAMSRPLIVREMYPNGPGEFDDPAGCPKQGGALVGGGQFYGRRWNLGHA